MSTKNSASALFWSLSDKLMTNGIALIISIILARIIDPSEYGIIATASIFTVILSLFVEPGMTSGLIQKKKSDKLDFSTILAFNLLVAGVLYLILFLCSDAISEWFAMPVLSSVIKVLGIQIIIGSVNSVQLAYVHKNMLFKRYFICAFVSVVVGASVGICMAYKGAGVWALVAYSLIKQATNAISVYFLFKCRFGLRFSKERFAQMFPFAGKMLFTKFIDQGYVEATQTIISKVYSTTDLAFYNKGKSFPDLLINNLNLALSSVLFPSFSNLQDDSEKFKNSVRLSVKMTSFVCIPMIIGLMACSENFVAVVLTSKWLESVPYLQLLCCYYIWIPFSNVMWQALKAKGKSAVVLKLEIIKMLLNISSLIVLLWWLKSPISVALSLAITYAVSFFVECIAAVKHLNYSVKEIVVDFCPSLALSCAMGAIVVVLGQLSIPGLFALILQIFAGIVFYVTISYFLHFSQITQIFSILKGKILSCVNRKNG